MQQEQASLQQSAKVRGNAIPDDYIVFLQEHEENDGKMEDDPIDFRQAMLRSNSKN